MGGHDASNVHTDGGGAGNPGHLAHRQRRLVEVLTQASFGNHTGTVAIAEA
jgi:hypothetical protein